MSSTTSSASRSAVRDIAGTRFPAPGRWGIDPSHADVAFVGRHFMLTKVRGRFTDVDGTVTIAEAPEDSSVEVTIGMASVSSGHDARDAHLRSAEMFDVETFPEATFRSAEVAWQGSAGVIRGDLTIHGVTRRVDLDFVFEGHARDPWGNDRAVFSASTTINREDFGLTWNMVLETGGVLVSKDIAIEIVVETVLER